MLGKEQQAALPKFTFKVKNFPGMSRIHDSKIYLHDQTNCKKVSVGSNTPKIICDYEFEQPIKGPWPISPTPITNKYHRQIDNRDLTLIKQMPHSIIFESRKKSPLGKDNYINSRIELKNQQMPRYVRQFNIQNHQREKIASAATIIKPEKIHLGKKSHAAISNFEREKFNKQYRRSKDNLRNSRKGNNNNQVIHYRQLSERKPNQRSLLVIKHTQDQFKEFCEESRIIKQQNTPKLIQKQVILNKYPEPEILPQMLGINETKQMKYNRENSHKKHRNRIHYHINAANQYKFNVGISNPQISQPKYSQQPLNKKNITLKLHQNKTNKTIGKIKRAQNKTKKDQMSLQKSSPQLQGSRFLSLLEPETKVMQVKPSQTQKMLQSTEMKRNHSKSPGKLTSTVSISEQTTKLQNSLALNSQQIKRKIYNPGFFVFKKPSTQDTNSYTFNIKTKVGKIKQVLVEAGQNLQINFELPQVLLFPPTRENTRKQIFEKMNQILKYLDLHTQIVKIKKYSNCAVLLYEKKNVQDQQHANTSINNLCIIWYYTGRIYIGGFTILQNVLPNSENSEIKLQQYLRKNGMGFQWFPTESVQSPQQQGYIFYGQFVENICQGYGIMRRYTKQLHIGLWQKGQKCGWGKSYSNKGQLQKNGQFFKGKLVKSII